MTKSRDKAKDGFVKVAINREEMFISPDELMINERKLKDILAENHAHQTAFENYRANTTLTLEKLIAKQKELEQKLEQYQQALISFMGDVMKGGLQ